MSQITIEKLFQMYMSTFNHCGMFLLDLPNEKIETYIFEEFDIEATTYLHHNTLNRLKDAEFIDAEEYDLSRVLRQKFMDLQGTSLWNVESVKTATEWVEIMRLADIIKNSIESNGKT